MDGLSIPIVVRMTDAMSIERLVRDYYASVFRFCARRIGEEAAQDAAQETFVTAHKSLKRFEGRSSELTWLLGIAHNHCRNLARKRKIEPCGLECWVEVASPGDIESQVVDRQALIEALARLTPEQRDALILHEIEGLRYAEAAEILGVPEGTVKSRLHYAFIELRKTLGGSVEVAR